MKLNSTRAEKWHRWFAWHPVWTDEGRVWLEVVLRRLVAADVFCEVYEYIRIEGDGDESR